MSLPLTRRIAKTVLLTAAGAASVVGTAGAASAAELPTTADVGGLSNLDTGVGDKVSHAASEGAQALTPMSSTSPLDQTDGVPEVGASAKTNNGPAASEAEKLIAGAAQHGLPKSPDVGKQVPDVRTKGLPTDETMKGDPARALPLEGATRAVTGGQTPVQGLIGGNGQSPISLG
ncbi:ATP-binding protein [Streptomyces marispadix]|uniref:ATP-binding protein n=1 Tax=Streptomyces marispadix TaxID=2922868 RepID=A0ABS9T1I8_9ACTN|nr:ATP-binding protein [Streptomyces marispadix]MCH6162387.1 ATP-binding protein [Streptomyces marispadix]